MTGLQERSAPGRGRGERGGGWSDGAGERAVAAAVGELLAQAPGWCPVHRPPASSRQRGAPPALPLAAHAAAKARREPAAAVPSYPRSPIAPPSRAPRQTCTALRTAGSDPCTPAAVARAVGTAPEITPPLSLRQAPTRRPAGIRGVPAARTQPLRKMSSLGDLLLRGWRMRAESCSGGCNVRESPAHPTPPTHLPTQLPLADAALRAARRCR
jgi:hypothetical protein